MRRALRHVFTILSAISLLLFVAVGVFQLLILPRLSPEYRAAAIQLRWPIAGERERSFDLCTYAGTIYVGTKIDPLETGGDPFTVNTAILARRKPKLLMGCGDLYWVPGAEYEYLVRDLGWQWRGSGYVHLPRVSDSQSPAADVIALTTSHLLLLLGASAAFNVPTYLRRRRERFARAHRLCTTCGYDLRASPECCPECGTVVDVQGGSTAAGVD